MNAIGDMVILVLVVFSVGGLAIGFFNKFALPKLKRPVDISIYHPKIQEIVLADRAAVAFTMALDGDLKKEDPFSLKHPSPLVRGWRWIWETNLESDARSFLHLIHIAAAQRPEQIQTNDDESKTDTTSDLASPNVSSNTQGIWPDNLSGIRRR